jgi:chromosome segregation ATPase
LSSVRDELAFEQTRAVRQATEIEELKVSLASARDELAFVKTRVVSQANEIDELYALRDKERVDADRQYLALNDLMTTTWDEGEHALGQLDIANDEIAARGKEIDELMAKLARTTHVVDDGACCCDNCMLAVLKSRAPAA